MNICSFYKIQLPNLYGFYFKIYYLFTFIKKLKKIEMYQNKIYINFCKLFNQN